MVRRRALALREAAAASSQAEPLAAWDLVRVCASHAGLDLIPRAPDDVLLNGAEAVLDRGIEAIFFNETVGREEAAALVAHELGHLELHEGTRSCGSRDVEVGAPDDPAPVGLERVEGYGARERQELQANVFARELLLPRHRARQLFVDEGVRAEELARRLGLGLDLVRQQLSAGVLLPPDPPPAPASTGDDLSLDPTQRAAAEHRGSPLLLEAGPGTGKTRTLVARIVHLLETGAEPESILALTFSNKAALEITDRVARSLPEAAPRIWTGTFHAFGLELLRKHHQLLGLEPEIRLYDRSDAIGLLEDRLPTLGLLHHQNLYEPALELKEILAAISRAKDELVDAEGYRALAEAMISETSSDAERKAAEKALEVARVYQAYEKALREKSALDFGDLIFRAVRLLEAHEEVRRGTTERYRHVLVDEYQDVNRASARLLRWLAGSGDGLWVVGDTRQSIYRFRGASEANLGLFLEDFPGAERKALGVNYRSSREIVETFTRFAGTMQTAGRSLELRLRAERGESGQGPDLRELDDAEAEVGAVAARITRLRAQGVPLRDQAILCRSNARLNSFAQGLESRRIPVLHLGSLFEREEVRDLLALLSLVCDPQGDGLVRVAAFPAYRIPARDVRRFLEARRDQLEVRALEALGRWREIEGLGPAGREGFRRLAADLQGVERRWTPWKILATYLFETSTYLEPLRDGESTADWLRGVALYQFLAFVRQSFPGGRGWPARRLLDRVRRLVLLGEERDLRQIPPSALHLDAVRLMTIHGSKGLEFEIVHIPSLQKSGLPLSYRGQRCPPPPGLITRVGPEEGGDRNAHRLEEECLFFVALSRARSGLHLYRSRTAGSARRGPSPYLDALGAGLGTVADPAVLELRGSTVAGVEMLGDPPQRVEGRDVTSYERCPRRYLYQRVLGLRGSHREGAFASTHRTIYQVIDWVREAPEDRLEAARVQAKLAEIWPGSGPAEHAFEAAYRRLAEEVLTHLVRAHRGEEMERDLHIDLELPGGAIRLVPDLVTRRPGGGVRLRLLKTGRKGSFKGDGTIHGLFEAGAVKTFGWDGYEVEVLHLTDGGLTPISLSQRQVMSRLQKSERLVRDLRQGKFPAAPDPMVCPRCPHFFLCPALPEGGVAWTLEDPVRSEEPAANDASAKVTSLRLVSPLDDDEEKAQ